MNVSCFVTKNQNHACFPISPTEKNENEVCNTYSVSIKHDVIEGVLLHFHPLLNI